jgi:hypothetical protein
MFDRLFFRSDSLTRQLSAVPPKPWKEDVALMQFLRSLW